MVNWFRQLLALIESPSHVTSTEPPQLSDVVTRLVFAAGTFAAQVTVTSAGQVMLGALVSFTTINCVQNDALPHASVAR